MFCLLIFRQILLPDQAQIASLTLGTLRSNQKCLIIYENIFGMVQKYFFDSLSFRIALYSQKSIFNFLWWSEWKFNAVIVSKWLQFYLRISWIKVLRIFFLFVQGHRERLCRYTILKKKCKFGFVQKTLLNF